MKQYLFTQCGGDVELAVLHGRFRECAPTVANGAAQLNEPVTVYSWATGAYESPEEAEKSGGMYRVGTFDTMQSCSDVLTACVNGAEALQHDAWEAIRFSFYAQPSVSPYVSDVWTNAKGRVAAAFGWDLFDTPRGVQILCSSEDSIFDDDDAAFDFVFKHAEDDTGLSSDWQLAINVIKANNPDYYDAQMERLLGQD